MTIDKLLEEKQYRQNDEHTYIRWLKDADQEYTYYPKNNNLIAKSVAKVSEDEWKKRCINWFGEDLADLGEFGYDTNIIIYNYYYDFYFIYSYKKVGFGGFGEYLMIKDDKYYDARIRETWNELSIDREKTEKILEWINSFVYFFTDKQAGITGTVSGSNVSYNEELIDEVYYLMKSLKKEIEELTKANICSSQKNDLITKIYGALENDDYKSLSKLVVDEMYIGGIPLIIEAIIQNKFKVLDELIDNKKCINQQDLIYRGRPASYAILKIQDPEIRMKYVKLFIKKKYDYNAEDAFQRNLLYDAIESNDENVFDFVYNLKNIKIDNIPSNDILAGSLDVPGFVGNERLMTPLQYACKFENYHAVKELATEENINLANMLGSCLYIAISSTLGTPNKYKIIEYLLKMGANPHWEYDDDSPFGNKISIVSLLEHFKNDEKLINIINKYL